LVIEVAVCLSLGDKIKETSAKSNVRAKKKEFAVDSCLTSDNHDTAQAVQRN